MQIRGGTGHGKSSLLARLILQLSQPYDIWHSDRTGARRVTHSAIEDPLFVIINGQDLSLFHQVRLAAEATGRTFRYFSLWPERSAFIDPFQFLSKSSTSAIELANLFVQAFNLDGGLGHGNLYFTSANIDALHQVVEQVARRRRAGEYVMLADVVKQIERNNVRDQQHIKMMLKFLLPFTQLQPGPAEPNKIDFARALREKEIICGIFPPLINSGPARQLAGIMAYGIIHAAQLESVSPAKPIVIIDEVQEIAGRSFGRLLEHARKQVSLVIAHQNTNQLKSGDMDLTEVVAANTDIKVHLTFANKEIDQLLDYSQESRGVLAGQVIDGENRISHSEREYVERVLSRNSILEFGAQRMKGFVMNNMSERYEEPTPIRIEHPISVELYEQIRHELPPLSQQKRGTQSGTSLAGQRRDRQDSAAGSAPPPRRQIHQTALTALLKQKQNTLRPGTGKHQD